MAFKHAVTRVNKGTCVAWKNVMFEILRRGSKSSYRGNARSRKVLTVKGKLC